jgi:hypothetical protein
MYPNRATRVLTLNFRGVAQNLLKCDAYVTDDSLYRDLKFVQRQTRYGADVALQRRIVDRIVRGGIAHVYLRVWQCASAADYLAPDGRRAFRALQTALSIVWNCTDKSTALCELLVRVAVVHLFLSELAGAELVGADLDADESRR